MLKKLSVDPFFCLEEEKRKRRMKLGEDSEKEDKGKEEGKVCGVENGGRGESGRRRRRKSRSSSRRRKRSKTFKHMHFIC